jgi:hypothetical protein
MHKFIANAAIALQRNISSQEIKIAKKHRGNKTKSPIISGFLQADKHSENSAVQDVPGDTGFSRAHNDHFAIR